MKKLLVRIRRPFRDNAGIGTVEVILILVVLIALVLIFKNQITTLAQSIFTQINKSVKDLY